MNIDFAGTKRDAELEYAYVQENISFYRESFDYMYEYETKIAWNWGAFFFPILWCWYRKLYLPALVNTVIYILAVFSDRVFLATACQMVFMGLYGTNIYRRHVVEEIAEIKDSYFEENQLGACRKMGGVDLLLVIVSIITNLLLYIAVNAPEILDGMRGFISSGSLYGLF